MGTFRVHTKITTNTGSCEKVLISSNMHLGRLKEVAQGLGLTLEDTFHTSVGECSIAQDKDGTARLWAIRTSY